MAQNPQKLRVVKLIGRATVIQTPRLLPIKDRDSPNSGPLRKINNRFAKAPILMNQTSRGPIKAFDTRRERDRHACNRNNINERIFNSTVDKTLRISQSVKILPKTEMVYEFNAESGIKKILKREEDTKIECLRAYKLVEGGLKKIVRVSNDEVHHQYIAKRSLAHSTKPQEKINNNFNV